MVETSSCDVAVIGGGVAGACAAKRLAAAGATVGLLALPERTEQPGEVLGPRARIQLAECGLPEPSSGSAPCEGVLSVWDNDSPDFADYALMTASTGLCIRRREMHRGFIEACGDAGIAVLACRRARMVVPEPGGRPIARWTCAQGRVHELQAGTLLVATGRSAGIRLANPLPRIRFDRAVALWVPYVHEDHAARLMIEATSGGWWYVSPAVEGGGALVLVTDADLVPRSRSARTAWLDRLFDESVLIRSSARARPDFSGAFGTDAHFGLHPRVAEFWGGLVGAAALSLDPLSGTGIARAIEGARRAAADIVGSGSLGRSYSSFIADMAAEESGLRRRTYRRAAARFPHSPFWNRRVDALSEMSRASRPGLRASPNDRPTTP